MERVVLEGADFEDWGRVNRVISQSWVDLEVRALGDVVAGAAWRFEMIGLGPVRIAETALGAPVEVVSDHADAYSVTIPVGGAVATRFGRQWISSTPDQATLNPVDTRLHIPRCEVPLLCVRVDSDYLESQYERVLGRRLHPLPGQLEVGAGEGRDWLTLLRGQYDQLRHRTSRLLDHPLVSEQLASTLVTGLLLAAAPEDRNDRLGTRPRIVHRVVAAIEADPARPWSLVELAELAGVSVRRLQQGFREYVGRSPFQHLHDVRLDRAHHDLVHAEPGVSVTDIALRWGLTHTGRFAADYRRRFGRSPSQTRRR